jgi:hypothetical protein|tara:strand:+ start:2050 stop:2253 length:204 start_codon:yes stop_codon:yes gene_type:complete
MEDWEPTPIEGKMTLADYRALYSLLNQAVEETRGLNRRADWHILMAAQQITHDGLLEAMRVSPLEAL